MLATTLSTQFIPGTNLKAQVVGANWLFLLPDLEIEQAVCLGVPKLSSLKTLSRLSRKVMIFSASKSGSRDIEKHDLKNISVAPFANLSKLFLPETLDLIILSDKSIIQSFLQDRGLQAELGLLLKPDGHLYFEYHEFNRKNYARQLSPTFGKQRSFWLTPSVGEMYTAVPVEDAVSTQFILDQHLDYPTIHMRGLSRVENKVNRLVSTTKIIRHYGTLISPGIPSEETGPPKYLKRIAEESGLFINDYRWFSVAGGGYSSRKLLFFLFEPGKKTPSAIVKMVRDPALNYRLENERCALLQLQTLAVKDSSRLPKILFSGHHRNLSIVGESYIEGIPFKNASLSSPECLKSGVEFLNNLAADTANPIGVTPKIVRDVLSKLYEQVSGIYQLSDRHAKFLQKQINNLGETQAPFPLVFQHGDPGIWNAVYNTHHQTVFLDWEAAEPEGMPLWDLFYYLRSYITWTARINGMRNQLQGIKHFLLEDTPMRSFWIDTTNQYCQRIGLSKELVEPLFYSCWMHRALKESTRLKPSKLGQGSYISLLRFFIDQHLSVSFWKD